MTHGFNAPVLVSIEEDGSAVRVAEERVYTGTQGDSWIIPKGFRTDFATIPTVLSWAIAKLGLWTLAAIVHDLLCVGLNEYRDKLERATHLGLILGDSNVIWPEKPKANAVDADAIFYRIVRDYGTDRVTASLLWTGVRWGALGNAARREGFMQTFWPWLGLSLAFAPVLLPATVLAVVGRLALRLARRIFR